MRMSDEEFEMKIDDLCGKMDKANARLSMAFWLFVATGILLVLDFIIGILAS